MLLQDGVPARRYRLVQRALEEANRRLQNSQALMVVVIDKRPSLQLDISRKWWVGSRVSIRTRPLSKSAASTTSTGRSFAEELLSGRLPTEVSPGKRQRHRRFRGRFDRVVRPKRTLSATELRGLASVLRPAPRNFSSLRCPGGRRCAVLVLLLTRCTAAALVAEHAARPQARCLLSPCGASSSCRRGRFDIAGLPAETVPAPDRRTRPRRQAGQCRRALRGWASVRRPADGGSRPSVRGQTQLAGGRPMRPRTPGE